MSLRQSLVRPGECYEVYMPPCPIALSHRILSSGFCSFPKCNSKSYFTPQLASSLPILITSVHNHFRDYNVSLLISINAPPASGGRGSLCRSTASLSTLSPLSSPSQPWQIILYFSDSNNRRSTIQPNICRYFPENEPEQL